MTETVLVTGAFGLVGSTTVRTLRDLGRRVIATDLRTPQNEQAAAAAGVDVQWADLTDPQSVTALVTSVEPTSIIHLAAVIPPFCYKHRALARTVNVDATRLLVEAAAGLPVPPRFVLASSIAVYGARNPHSDIGVLTADTAVAPSDIYGAHKVAAEAIVRASPLPWVVLRLGGVMTAEPRLDLDLNLVYFEGLLPVDGRIQTVDVRDVALAFATATQAAVIGETLLIGGDDTHRLRQGDIGRATSAAMGAKRLLPPGRPGNPADSAGWFATDWMDTSRAQEALDYQRHNWPDVLAETRRLMGRRRYVVRVLAPFARRYFTRKGPYWRRAGTYADPWGTVESRWGDYRPDEPMN